MCSVRNIGHRSCHHLLDRVYWLLHTDLQIPGSVVSVWRVSDTWLQALVIKVSSPTTPGNRLTATVQLHWCQTDSTVAYSESLAYLATLGGTLDRDHWSWSAVDDVTPCSSVWFLVVLITARLWCMYSSVICDERKKKNWRRTFGNVFGRFSNESINWAVLWLIVI